jgi:hypothetical protein
MTLFRQNFRLIDVSEMSYEEIVSRIIELNTDIYRFWSNAKGWAPLEAAELLSKSNLSWLISLSHCLRKWETATDEEMHDGELILAWSNLGSLVEGSLKLFLSVYYEDYCQDIENKRKEDDNFKFRKPDVVPFKLLRSFFSEKIWDVNIDTADWDTWLEKIQERRNAIHAFRNREIGNFQEFHDETRTYLEFMTEIDSRLPYPDGY